LFATDPKNRPLSLFIATHPKTQDLKRDYSLDTTP
jgi:hypothetical protein